MNCKGKLINFDTPKVMGILNITENSFFDGGKYSNNPDKYLQRIETMLEEGADIIDIGCMATNPQAKELSENEELKAVETALYNVIPRFPEVIFSIDTWRSQVAQTAVEMGVSIINDISGGDFDEKMFALVAKLQVPYILMHTSDKPEKMQQKTDYDNVVHDIFLYIRKKVEQLHLLGVNDVIIDMGFGFGKTIPQNYELLKHLPLFKSLSLPVLVGLSRKSMLYNLLNISPAEALNATTVVNTIALLNGADILRVHDVKEAKETVKIVSYYSFPNKANIFPL
jgi:dihydropteroate synthase